MKKRGFQNSKKRTLLFPILLILFILSKNTARRAG